MDILPRPRSILIRHYGVDSTEYYITKFLRSNMPKTNNTETRAGGANAYHLPLPETKHDYLRSILRKVLTHHDIRDDDNPSRSKGMSKSYMDTND